MSQTNLDIPPNNLEAYWMPMTPNRRFKSAPEFFVEAKGMHYKTPEGRSVLDAIAGLWCVNAGHCHPKIIEAIRRCGLYRTVDCRRPVRAEARQQAVPYRAPPPSQSACRKLHRSTNVIR